MGAAVWSSSASWKSFSWFPACSLRAPHDQSRNVLLIPQCGEARVEVVCIVFKEIRKYSSSDVEER